MTADSTFTPITEPQVLEILQKVYDPEFQASIVDIGLIYSVNVSKDGTVNVEMTLTSPGCPYADWLVSTVVMILEAQQNVTAVNLQMVWEPPWSPDRMSPALRYEHDMDFW